MFVALAAVRKSEASFPKDTHETSVIVLHGGGA
jgi:hypothetical protein